MSGRERCYEIVRLIDQVLADQEGIDTSADRRMSDGWKEQP